MSRPFELVLFDLDGVLIDSRRVMELSWAAVQDRFGVEQPFESYFGLIGRPFVDIMAGLGLSALAAEIESVYMAASLANFQHGLQFAGIDEMLTDITAKGVAIGIITSKDAVRTKKILAYFPVPFDVVGTPESVRRGKPAPDPLLAAMVQIGVDPADTLFVGDMDVDEEAARRAGVPYAHVSWGYGAPPPASRVVETPADIVAVALDADDAR